MRAHDLPYILLRVVRRSLPLIVVKRLGAVFPWIGTSIGEISSELLVNWYYKWFRASSPPVDFLGATILEVGTGATNAACYELVADGALFCHSYEPFATLDQRMDGAMLTGCASRHGLEPDFIRKRISRATSLEKMESNSVDLVLSNSVLEHVTDIAALNRQLARILKPGGRMVHIVDYRDHFFAYPYHHLLWSRATWNRWLNPGHLPRWRITDHIRAFENIGLNVAIIDSTSDPDAFEKVRNRIHPDFAGYPDDQIAVTWAVIVVRKPEDYVVGGGDG